MNKLTENWVSVMAFIVVVVGTGYWYASKQAPAPTAVVPAPNDSLNAAATSSTTSQPTNRVVQLYYYNPALDEAPGGIACSRKGLVAVTRTIPATITPLKDVITLLLQGNLTAAERAQGVTTEFPLPGVTLQSAAINDGVATLTFNDPQNKTGGGACRVGILGFQIEATARQFTNVTSVRLMPAELFQP